jgi:hypothetical protein
MKSLTPATSLIQRYLVPRDEAAAANAHMLPCIDPVGGVKPFAFAKPICFFNLLANGSAGILSDGLRGLQTASTALSQPISAGIWYRAFLGTSGVEFPQGCLPKSCAIVCLHFCYHLPDDSQPTMAVMAAQLQPNLVLPVSMSSPASPSYPCNY